MSANDHRRAMEPWLIGDVACSTDLPGNLQLFVVTGATPGPDGISELSGVFFSFDEGIDYRADEITTPDSAYANVMHLTGEDAAAKRREIAQLLWNCWQVDPLSEMDPDDAEAVLEERRYRCTQLHVALGDDGLPQVDTPVSGGARESQNEPA